MTTIWLVSCLSCLAKDVLASSRAAELPCSTAWSKCSDVCARLLSSIPCLLVQRIARMNSATCLVCTAQALEEPVWIRHQGVPHHKAGHRFTYTAQRLQRCGACGSSQIEYYSHDCFAYYEDEEWDMYWWYALDSHSTHAFFDFLVSCPKIHATDCTCPAHKALRARELPWTGLRSTYSRDEPRQFANVQFTVQHSQPAWALATS